MRITRYIAAFILIAIQGCTKDTAPKDNGQTVKPGDFGRLPFVVKDNYTFSLYSQVLDTTKYGDTLALKEGPYTIFVPNNNAFSAASFYFGNGTNYLLYAYNPPAADYVRGMIIPQKVSMKDLRLGENQTFQTLEGSPVYITKYRSQTGDTIITVNGVPLVQNGWDLPATNGTINVLTGVPEPQVLPNVWQLMLGDGNLAFFTLAVQRAGLQSLFETTNEKLTVLAPTNFSMSNMYVDTAHGGLDLRSIDAIRNANPDSIKKMVLYHVLKGTWFVNDFTRRDTLPNGDTVQLTTYDGAALGFRNNSFIGTGLVPAMRWDYPNGVETMVYDGPPGPLPINFWYGYVYNMPRIAFQDKVAGNGVVQEMLGVLIR
ncbi:MAG: fasciclin domain-containing protein [Chitinophagaceae bacterium]|nr:fasciclin domain-containing protein [Chitinophagaceae bacterium]